MQSFLWWIFCSSISPYQSPTLTVYSERSEVLFGRLQSAPSEARMYKRKLETENEEEPPSKKMGPAVSESEAFQLLERLDRLREKWYTNFGTWQSAGSSLILPRSSCAMCFNAHVRVSSDPWVQLHAFPPIDMPLDSGTSQLAFLALAVPFRLCFGRQYTELSLLTLPSFLPTVLQRLVVDYAASDTWIVELHCAGKLYGISVVDRFFVGECSSLEEEQILTKHLRQFGAGYICHELTVYPLPWLQKTIQAVEEAATAPSGASAVHK